jgi:hypothetical protein
MAARMTYGELMDILKKGVDEPNALFIDQFPIKSLSLSRNTIAQAMLDVRQRKIHVKKEPVEVVYNTKTGQFITRIHDYYTLIDYISKKQKFIPVKIWSAEYSDYHSNVHEDDLFFEPDPINSFSQKFSILKETYYDELSDDEQETLARRYFSIGQDEDDMEKGWCWLWDKGSQVIKAKQGGTHAINFGHTAKEYTYSGWYDPEKNIISFSFPNSELRKFGNRRPTEDDIPQIVYQKLMSKFGKQKAQIVVFESKNFDISKEDLKLFLKEIVKLRNESPDTVAIDGDEIDFTNTENVESILFYYIMNGETVYFSYVPRDRKIYCNNKEYEQIIANYVNEHKEWPVYKGDADTHGTVTRIIMKTSLGQLQRTRLMHARLFRFDETIDRDETFVFACWESKEKLKTHMQIVEQSLRDLNLDPQKVLYEPEDYEGEHLTYSEIKGATDKEPTTDEKTAWLKQQLHLNPDLKKLFLNLPPNRYQSVADKLNITTIQLRQLLGRDVAETKTESLNKKQLKFILKEITKQVLGDEEPEEKEMLYKPYGGWLDPNLNFHEVDHEAHRSWALRYLEHHHPEERKLLAGETTYDKMYRLGFVRVIIEENKLYYEYKIGNPPEQKKIKALKDLAIEYDCEVIEDGMTGKLDDLLQEIKSNQPVIITVNETMTYKELLGLTTDDRKERASDVRVRSIPVSVEEGQEHWNFRYKSSPTTTVTDEPFEGHIIFLKGEVEPSDNAMDLECKVDCGCPDFMYRFAYNDTQKDASDIGPDSLSGCINRKPKPAYDYGEGLCKHLAALSRYLRTKISATKKSNLFEAIGEVAKQGPFNITYYDD